MGLMTFDVVKAWADMVKCRPVDLGPSFERRLKKLEGVIREEAARICDEIERQQLLRAVGDRWNGPDTAADCAKEIRAMRAVDGTKEVVQR